MESKNANLAQLQRIFRLYETMTGGLCERYGFTRTETNVLSFLANNPGLDTARDIVEYRAIPKANVSQAVEQLIQKGMLTRRQDTRDRRHIHLELTERAAAPVQELAQLREEYKRILYQGLTPEEYALYQSLTDRITDNVNREMERIEAYGKK